MYAYCRFHLTRLQVVLLSSLIMLLIVMSASAQSDGARPLPTDEYSVDPHADLIAPHPLQPEETAGEDVWTLTSATNAPTPTYKASAIWAGSEMIVWGGYTIDNVPVNAGGRYNPTTDSWQPTATAGAPSPRYNHVAVWTGSEMLIWGGKCPTANNTGGGFNSSTNQWRPITTTGAPPAQENGYKGVWTGKEMIVWAQDGGGGRYDPRLDQWRPITTTGAPTPHPYYPAFAMVWTGEEVLVYLTYNTGVMMSGGRYDPASDSWQPMSLVNAPIVDMDAAVVWTGKEMFVFGGATTGGNGGRYNPRTDTWAPASQDLEQVTQGIWTGVDVVFLTTYKYGAYGLFGMRYDPSLNEWVELPSRSCSPGPTPFGVSVWTGHEILLWGAQGGCGGTAGLRLTPPYRATRRYSVSADTYIASGRPSQYFGSDPLLFNGWDSKYGYGIERMLVQFETYQIPSRSTIEQAVAYLYLYAYNTGATTMNISVHRATSVWYEGSTWNTANNIYNPTPSAIVAVDKTFGWYGWNVTSIAQGWKQGIPDYGFMFLGNSSGSHNERIFIARDAGGGAVPFLAVTYTDPAYAADSAPPSASIFDLPMAHRYATPLHVRWTGFDQGHGVFNFDVQVRDESTGIWNDWYSWAVGSSADFVGTAGHTFCFRVRARDYAGNAGGWSTDSRCTTFYTRSVAGQIVDHRHIPVAKASLQAQPAAFTTTVSLLTGQHALYFADDQPRQVTVNQPAYTAPPVANIAITVTDHYDFVMQPTDNVVLNSNFESGLASWKVGGTLPVSTTNFRHSGDLAIALNSKFALTAGTASIVQALAIPALDAPQVLSFMYNLTTTSPLSNSQLAVALATSGNATTIWSTRTICASWCHAWVDVGAWRGQNVTLTMSLVQVTGETLQATVDEIVLGSWRTPIVEQVAPARIDAHVSTVITLTGQNFLAEPLSSGYFTGPTVLLDTMPIETRWISTCALTATAPATIPYGLYTVWVFNPGGPGGALPDGLRVGHIMLLPLLMKAN